MSESEYLSKNRTVREASPAHCSTSALRLMSVALGLAARAEKVGEPATRAVAMVHRQSEQKPSEVESAWARRTAGKRSQEQIFRV